MGGITRHDCGSEGQNDFSAEELRRRRADLKARGGFPYPASQTPWQEIQRSMVDQLSEGMTLKPAVKYQRVAQAFGVPRDNH